MRPLSLEGTVSDTIKTNVVGWIIFLVGSATYLYGYFVGGHPPMVDWHARTPWWIADFLPNLECEIGMLVCVVGMVPMYWPTGR